MNIKQGIQDVLYLIITGVLPLLITYGILFLKVKIKEQEKNLENDQLVKYIDAATDAISKAVLTVNQTAAPSESPERIAVALLPTTLTLLIIGASGFSSAAFPSALTDLEPV